MKYFLFLVTILLLSGCESQKTNKNQLESVYPFYVGTYTSKDSKGIYKYSLQKDGGLKLIGLVAKSVNPSFLVMSTDKKYLISVGENDYNGQGSLESYLIRGDSLDFLSRSSSGGAHPCHVSTNDSGFVLVANYTGGNVGLLKLNHKGEFNGLLDVEQHTGSGSTDRQKAPHAHSAWFNSTGNEIISVDLGTNELWFSHLDTVEQKLLPNTEVKLKMDIGAGPRHLTFHPNKKWIYVLNELNSTVTLVNKTSNGTYTKIISTSTLPDNFSEQNTCADIHISSDGKFVYASNRGHDSIAIFKVNEKDGTLNLIGHQSTHGKTPRNFSLSPDENYLLVANQNTDNIVSLKRDKTTGLLEYVSEIDAPTPVCILF